MSRGCRLNVSERELTTHFLTPSTIARRYPPLSDQPPQTSPCCRLPGRVRLPSGSHAPPTTVVPVSPIQDKFLEQIELFLWPALSSHCLGTESPQSYPSLTRLAVQEECVAFLLRRIGGKYRCRGESNRETRRGE